MSIPLADVPPEEPVQSTAMAAWSAVVDRARHDLSEPSFKLWFEGLAPGPLKGDVLDLFVPSGYVKTWLTGHYMGLITSSARSVLGPSATVRLRIDQRLAG